MCARPKRAPFLLSTASRVLERLQSAAGGYVSGESISRDIGISRVAIWKAVRTLRGQGCIVEALRHCGYRLIGNPDLPTADAVRSALRTQTLGRSLLFFREVDSTNRQLAKLADAGAPEGQMVVADCQSAGRGRMGRIWFSPLGVNLYFSILLRPPVGPAQIATLPLAVGCAVIRAVARIAPEMPVGLKWPNDLYVGERKLGGILCEMAAETDRVSHVVVGIGLNVNVRRRDLPAPLSRTATSLAIETRRMFPRAETLAEIVNQLEPVYATWCAEGLAPFLPEIAAVDLLKGRRIRIEQDGRTVEGVAGGVQTDGALLVRLPDGARTSVCSGDTHILSPNAARDAVV